MDKEKLEGELHISLYIIIYKFALGLIELILGLGILLFGDRFLDLYNNFKSQELLEDPHDTFVMIAEKLLPYIWDHKGYIILILIVLATVKIIGSIGLFYRKHWGLDLLVGLTFLILPFELFNLIIHPSLPKTIFFIFNIFIALYLVEFQPKSYFIRFKSRISSKSVN